jgi:hypothetical protein
MQGPIFNSMAQWASLMSGAETQSSGWNRTMKASKNTSGFWMLAAVLGCGLTANTGCQVQVAGQTLPSPYYLMDDVQYFPAGSENKLANETAALKAEREEARASRP